MQDDTSLSVSRVLGVSDIEGYALAERIREFRFPEDHGPHPDYRSEWWYLTVILQDTQNREYGVQFTLFRQALWPPEAQSAEEPDNPWLERQAYLGHLALTSVTEQSHQHDQRFARGHPRLAHVTPDPFKANIEDWTLRMEGDRWRLNAKSQAFAVNLQFNPVTPPVLQGNQGLSAKGPGSASYYYSMPRIQTSGEVCQRSQCSKVSGLGWFDREWSTSVLGSHLLGWDWFALQLDDGRSIMAFRLRRKDGARDPYDHGVVVTGDQTQHLSVSDFQLIPLRDWQDEYGNQWPVRWQLQLFDEQLEVEALVEDQLMDMGLVYWEGIVGIQDAQGNKLGRGYMELTGY